MRLYLFLLTLALGGCSATQLAYNNSDWLLISELDDRFDLTREQRAQLKTSIPELIDWHRREALPAYATILERWHLLLSDGLNAGDLTLITDDLIAIRNNSLDNGLPTISAFLATLSLEQVDHYDEFWQEYMEDTLERSEWTLEEQQQYKADLWIDRIENWTGFLDADQKQLIHQRIKQIPDFHSAWVASRTRQHQRFTTLLRSTVNLPHDHRQQRILEHLDKLWRHPAANYSPAQRETRRAYWAATDQLILAIDAMLTTGQRNNLLDKIEDYKEDALELSRQ